MKPGIPLALLLGLLPACTRPQPVPVPPAPPPPAPPPVRKATLITDAQSTPGQAQLTFRGKAIGQTPQSISVEGAGDLLDLTASRDGEEAVEKRIRFLSPDRAEVHFIFGKDRSALARALGFSKVLVFEYGVGITFDTDHATLKPEFLPLLARQAEMLTTHFGTLDIHVCGHTDATGQKTYNLALSLARAKAVADELAARGVPRSRMKVQGFGSSFPVAPNDSIENRALNRRTELVLPQ